MFLPLSVCLSAVQFRAKSDPASCSCVGGFVFKYQWLIGRRTCDTAAAAAAAATLASSNSHFNNSLEIAVHVTHECVRRRSASVHLCICARLVVLSASPHTDSSTALIHFSRLTAR